MSMAMTKSRAALFIHFHECFAGFLPNGQPFFWCKTMGSVMSEKVKWSSIITTFSNKTHHMPPSLGEQEHNIARAGVRQPLRIVRAHGTPSDKGVVQSLEDRERHRHVPDSAPLVVAARRGRSRSRRWSEELEFRLPISHGRHLGVVVIETVERVVRYYSLHVKGLERGESREEGKDHIEVRNRCLASAAAIDIVYLCMSTHQNRRGTQQSKELLLRQPSLVMP
jgi:hypothetical protein